MADLERHPNDANDAGRQAPARPLLEIQCLTKAFGGNRALNAASLTVGSGEIRALIGQNGCGKSTFIKVLSGYHTPDEGQVRLHDEQVALPIGRDTLNTHGVTFLHQDLGLVPTLSVLENLRVGRLHTRGGRIHW
ncbi:MAG: ATP-binding cassette domain-containing protein, partial [Sciscionella sp.]